MQARSPDKAFPLKDHFDMLLLSLKKAYKSIYHTQKHKAYHVIFFKFFLTC